MEVYSGTLKMDRIDLEITPVESAVRIVMVYFAVASRVLGPLYCERDSAGGAELITSVLLERRQLVAKLIDLDLPLLLHDSR
jgi:hypothetical protein